MYPGCWYICLRDCTIWNGLQIKNYTWKNLFNQWISKKLENSFKFNAIEKCNQINIIYDKQKSWETTKSTWNKIKLEF